MRVAILLATYNGEKYISEMLDSLLSQSYHDFVCFIHDDGSSDRTTEIIKSYCFKYSEMFKIIEYEPTGGASNNFLSLLKVVDGFDYYMFCDQDDVWFENKIELSIKYAKKIKKDIPLMVVSDQKIVDHNLNVIEDSYFKFYKIPLKNIRLQDVLFEGFVPGCTMLINDTLKNKVLDYKNKQNIYMHDWWATEVVLALKGQVIVIDEPLMLYRQHENNCIGANKTTLLYRVMHNILEFFKGTLHDSKHKRISRAFNQASELLYVDGINDACQDFVKSLLALEKKNKLSRIAYYGKNIRTIKGVKGLLFWL